MQPRDVEQAGAAHGHGRLCSERLERERRARACAERRGGVVALEHAQAENAFVELDAAAEIGDREPHGADRETGVDRRELVRRGLSGLLGHGAKTGARVEATTHGPGARMYKLARMQYRKLGWSELSVSEISLGSWLTYSGGVEREQAVACVQAAFEEGINFIDTANIYGRGASETF